ncbi:hypothetical protein ACFSYD_06000 [Paracoccus aerius]
MAFAGMGDRVMLEPGPLSLRIDGPFAAGLSTENNLACTPRGWRAARPRSG